MGHKALEIRKPENFQKHMKKYSSVAKMNSKILTPVKEEKTNDTEEEFGKISKDKFARSYSEKELFVESHLP